MVLLHFLLHVSLQILGMEVIGAEDRFGQAAKAASPEYVVQDRTPPVNHAIAAVLAVCAPISFPLPNAPQGT